MGRDLHTRNVEKAIDKLATIISLFLASIRFYGKRVDLYFNKLPAYVDKPQSKLKVVFIKNVSQQDPSTNDYELYACLFAKYISNGVFYMGLIHIDAKYHRKRYATIMWQYGRSKNADGTIGESEVTGMVC
ncbi:hypothetical protein H5410_020217 [Solanum commersonii]|uniref:Uncharacterized protein n=1 Tax=Solanum commersonii TaxID=4109 RepID=A0A9J5ZAK9_SOLCO|nr:hypothetical protein H5410_020217 [Solanum commersonii]